MFLARGGWYVRLAGVSGGVRVWLLCGARETKPLGGAEVRTGRPLYSTFSLPARTKTTAPGLFPLGFVLFFSSSPSSVPGR